MIDIISQKNNLRKQLSKKRNLIKKNSLVEFNPEAFSKLIKLINFDEIKYVGSFISIRSEISTNQLNENIIKLQKVLAFPIIKKNSKELLFKKIKINQNLKHGMFNIPEPPNENEEILPQLFFVPCLGFDLNGYRLGYGGGYYDKTFSKLNKLNHKFYTVGYAFDNQKQNKIPRESFDYKLDFVLTEKDLYSIL
tara:strand:- start:485 stop:1066 length:582 start_codon:yes stop_codon:yes gene_type:complete